MALQTQVTVQSVALESSGNTFTVTAAAVVYDDSFGGPGHDPITPADVLNNRQDITFQTGLRFVGGGFVQQLTTRVRNAEQRIPITLTAELRGVPENTTSSLEMRVAYAAHSPSFRPSNFTELGRFPLTVVTPLGRTLPFTNLRVTDTLPKQVQIQGVFQRAYSREDVLFLRFTRLDINESFTETLPLRVFYEDQQARRSAFGDNPELADRIGGLWPRSTELIPRTAYTLQVSLNATFPEARTHTLEFRTEPLLVDGVLNATELLDERQNYWSSYMGLNIEFDTAPYPAGYSEDLGRIV